MNKEKRIIVALGLIIILIIIGIAILVLNQFNNQFFQYCADKGWEGVHEIKGDFSGFIDCEIMWKENFADGKWTKKCSNSLFSIKPSCHFLCIESCKIINKQREEQVCVC